jgi:hypothetical protein
MKRPLRQKWALHVAKQPAQLIVAYLFLFMPLTQGPLFLLTEKEHHLYFFICSLAISFYLFERVGLIEFLKEKDREIEDLKRKSGD